jgi:uncharacterized membrane protein YczE
MPRLLVGIVLLGVGIGVMVRAALGLSPWDVLHQGLAKRTGLDLGTVVILVGVVVLLGWLPLRQRLGSGTVLNALGVGVVVNVTLDVVARPDALAWRVVLLVVGVTIVGAGTGLYIGAGLGPGPRDGLMTGIAARGFPLWAVRTVLELSALAAGSLLGGNVGVGTVVFAFGIGPLAHGFLRVFHLPAPTAELGPGVAAD